jgi:hypothetical protein
MAVHPQTCFYAFDSRAMARLLCVLLAASLLRSRVPESNEFAVSNDSRYDRNRTNIHSHRLGICIYPVLDWRKRI